jgi:GH25 family lysozyme M1 (1,4-beta-N-acetylmuramidase)
VIWPKGVPGLDISSIQAPARCDYQKLAASAAWAFVRVTEGNSIDKAHRQHLEGLKGSGVFVGGYCFARPRHPAVEEADIFLSGLGDDAYDLPPCLDLERGDRPDDLPPDQLLAWAQAWLDRVELVTLQKPLIYGSYGFLDGALPKTHDLGTRCGLWVAHYGVKAPRLPRGWTTSVAWQWSGNGRVDGFDGDLDCSVTDSIDGIRTAGFGLADELGAMDTDRPEPLA